jgi:peptidoglycan hydrolase CwlO-like protein
MNYPIQQTLGSLLEQIETMQTALTRHERELTQLHQNLNQLETPLNEQPPMEFQLPDTV